MGLSYYYEFTAPATNTPAELEAFLRNVERTAGSLGFAPTTVLNVPFDTPERREFSRRLGSTLTVQDERLGGVALPVPGFIRDHDPAVGECRVYPEHGVVLIATDEQGREACFGFFRFPNAIHDIGGNVIAKTRLHGAWFFRSFVDSPDPRFRKLVREFASRGFLKSEKDDFHVAERGQRKA